MSVSKCLLVGILLLPICLLEATQNSINITGELANSVIFETHKSLDYGQYLDFRRQRAGVQAEALADELQEFLLDDNLQFKEEFLNALRAAPQSYEYITKMRKLIANGACREELVKFRKQQTLELIDKYGRDEAKEHAGSTFFGVIAKNKANNNIMGFAVFENFPENTNKADTVDVDIMEVIPSARNKGLEAALMFSIKELLPTKKRLTMATQVWFKRELDLYHKLGCIKYGSNATNVYFEYIFKA
ncbi:MAG: GNAT family N-acetyltransferase [Candidatus Babeliales bacterium]